MPSLLDYTATALLFIYYYVCECVCVCVISIHSALYTRAAVAAADSTGDRSRFYSWVLLVSHKMAAVTAHKTTTITDTHTHTQRTHRRTHGQTRPRCRVLLEVSSGNRRQRSSAGNVAEEEQQQSEGGSSGRSRSSKGDGRRGRQGVRLRCVGCEGRH